MPHRDIPYVAIRPRTQRLGRVVHHEASVDSTMRVARRLAESDAPEGLVVVADAQSEGVGRHGRPWDNVGTSLYATFVLRPSRGGNDLGLLPLAVGVALAEAVEALTRRQVGLKWPNDVVVDDQKLAGILVDAVYAGEDRPRYALAGLGVNGDARVEDFPEALRGRATSLSLVAGRHVCLPALLKLVAERLEPRYEALLGGRTEEVWEATRRRLVTLGRRVRVQTPAGRLEGDAVDLGPEGELLVRRAGEIHAVRAGECEELRGA